VGVVDFDDGSFYGWKSFDIQAIHEIRRLQGFRINANPSSPTPN
jgi:hypothetical protein